MTDIDSAAAGLAGLVDILRHLRSDRGCIWDRRQTKEDLVRYLLEEAYEVADAVSSGSPEDLKEELGDLIFQALFLAEISREKGEFDLSQVLAGLSAKMIRRHPHVFSGTTALTVSEVKANWEKIKSGEKNCPGQRDIFQGIPRSLPSLVRAERIGERASRVGFDWPGVPEVLAAVEEEFLELKEAIAEGDQARRKEELGDLLFSLVNLSRFLGISPDEALKGTIDKFLERFSYLEGKLAAAGKGPLSSSLEEMDRLWNEAKTTKEK